MLIIPELMMGGAQRSLSKLSVELARHHQVWVVVFNTRDGIAYAHGGELVSLEVMHGESLVQKVISFFQRIIRLRRLKRELAIDVAISFLEGADYVNILSRRSEKIVVSIRGSKQYDDNIAGQYAWVRKKILIPWLYRMADTIVTVNHGIAQELKLQYGLSSTHIETIGNFYNLSEIEKLAAEPKRKAEEDFYQNPVIITTGRFAPEKGLVALLHIFSGLKRSHDNLKFILVGDGPLKKDILVTCLQLKLSVHEGFDFAELPDVVIAGPQENVFKYLKGATLYVMNSSSEGFPNGLAEAMICRVPVASSDCPYGPREILAPEFQFTSSVVEPYSASYGLLLPMIHSENDHPLWIESLNALLRDPNQLSKLSDQGYTRIRQFSLDSSMDQWNNVLHVTTGDKS